VGLGSTAEKLGEDDLVLAHYLPFRLVRAAQAVSALMAATWNERLGLSVPAWRVLCVLAEAAPQGRAELAERTALAVAEVGEAAADLLARGLVGRSGTPDGLTLTAAGLATHAELAELALAAEAALLSGLTPAEVHSLHRLLARLQAAAVRLAG
jgi:DNA-binding MarR family transcriptional regulator